MNIRPPGGAGLGFRRELIADLEAGVPQDVAFFEIAPENWAGMGGRSARQLRVFTERYPFVCHGLSLSLGGPGALDTALLRRIRAFMAEHGIALYTEHLSWCADERHLYELLPIPQTAEAVRWTAARIRQVQDLLGCRIGIENASTYIAPPGAEMSEAEFIAAVVAEADCLLHLDVNNIYVNSRNFGFDPLAFHALVHHNPSNQDHLDLRLAHANFADQFQAGHTRQAQVGNQQIKRKPRRL